jgi:hypothetical protein
MFLSLIEAESADRRELPSGADLAIKAMSMPFARRIGIQQDFSMIRVADASPGRSAQLAVVTLSDAYGE